MIEVEEAVARLTCRITPQTQTITRPLLEAAGGVLAREVTAPFSVPPFPKSAMDGYALRSADSHGKEPTLRVIGETLAGKPCNCQGEAGTAVRIMTGGQVPAGYDCVIRQEDTDMGTETVQLYKEMQPFENYCRVGEDIEEGTVVLPANTCLGSLHLGILASLGLDTVEMLRPMRVAIVSTGTELVPPGQPLGDGQIHNSCGYTLAAFIRSAGQSVVCTDICDDNKEHLRTRLRQRLQESDLLITTGGVSVGKTDHIPDVVESLGAERIFQRVNMKPGTPVLASALDGKLILSLSGNPFAALTNFHLFFWPVLAGFLRCSSLLPSRRRGVIVRGGLKASKLRRFVRAYEQNGAVTLPTAVHSASVLSNLLECNCLIDQSPGRELETGDRVSLLPFG